MAVAVQAHRKNAVAAEFFKRRRVRYSLVLGLTVAMVVVFFMLNVALGSVRIPLSETWHIILGGEGSNEIFSPVVWKLRLPRALTASLSGSSLAVSGVLLQAFFRNPIVGPSVLGLTAGASVMVALVTLAGITLGIAWVNPLFLSLVAFIGALGVMLIVMAVASRVRDIVTLLLMGLMIGYVGLALLNFIITFAEKERIAGFIMWTMGSFSGSRWMEVQILAVAAAGLLLGSFLLSKPLNAFLLGENYAQSLGVNIRLLRYLIILISSALAGVVTAFAGPVAFIGIAVPHMARLSLGTSDNRILIPAVILLGAAVTSFCDLLARMLFAPMELPISATTSVIGAPIVIALLLTRKAGI